MQTAHIGWHTQAGNDVGNMRILLISLIGERAAARRQAADGHSVSQTIAVS